MVNAFQFFPWHAQFFDFAPPSEEDGVVIAAQLVELEIAAYVDFGVKNHAPLAQKIDTAFDDRFVELERRNAIHQQATQHRQALQHRDFVAALDQFIRASQPGGPRADHSHAKAIRKNTMHLHVAVRKSILLDKFLDGADGDRLRAFVQRAHAFAQPFLRADREQISGMLLEARGRGGFEKAGLPPSIASIPECDC